MIGPKSLTSALQDLRPADNSTASIAASLRRLADLKFSDAEEIGRLEKSRTAMLLNASPAEIDQADQTVRQLKIRAEQLDVMRPELERLLADARLAEHEEEYSTTLAELTARAEAWNAKFQAEYPTWCAAIQPLFDKEKEIEAAIRAMTEMPGARRAQPNVADNFFYASRIMLRHGRHSMSQGVRFGEAVRRPPIPEDAP